MERARRALRRDRGPVPARAQGRRAAGGRARAEGADGRARTLAEPAVSEEQKLIVVAHDLSPADMILFKRHRFGGFVTDVGGVTSHTAIVARSLGIPAIVGLHHARQTISEGELLIVDGEHGVLIVNPDPAGARRIPRAPGASSRPSASRLKRLQDDAAPRRSTARRSSSTPTSSCRRTWPRCSSPAPRAWACSAPSSCSSTARTCPARTSSSRPTAQVAEAMQGRPVVLRTLDVGADKAMNGNGGAHTMPNPAMGLRAIRFCLAEPQMFLTQLRAILRASHYGKVRILLPMLAHAHEIDQTLHPDPPGEGAARRGARSLRPGDPGRSTPQRRTRHGRCMCPNAGNRRSA